MYEKIGEAGTERTINNIWHSYMLSQGNIGLQNRLLWLHFQNNPDQAEIYNNLSDEQVDHALDKILRVVNSDKHTVPEASDLQNEVNRLEVHEVPNAFGSDLLTIGTEILDRDHKFLILSQRTRPATAHYNLFHPKTSFLIYYGVTNRCDNRAKINSIATQSFDELLTNLKSDEHSYDDLHKAEERAEYLAQICSVHLENFDIESERVCQLYDFAVERHRHFSFPNQD